MLVDAPYTHEQIRQVGDWVEAVREAPVAIYATHGHGDHWFGTAALLNASPTRSRTPARAPSRDAQAAPGPRAAVGLDFPGLIPPSPVVYEPIPAEGLTLEGQQLVAVEVGHTDTDDTTVLHVPSIGLVVAGDAVYNGVHQMLVGKHRVAAWKPG